MIKKEVVGGNVVEGRGFFDKGYKFAESKEMVGALRDDISVSMKDMLGNKRAVAVRVTAV